MERSHEAMRSRPPNPDYALGGVAAALELTGVPIVAPACTGVASAQGLHQRCQVAGNWQSRLRETCLDVRVQVLLAGERPVCAEDRRWAARRAALVLPGHLAGGPGSRETTTAVRRGGRPCDGPPEVRQSVRPRRRDACRAAPTATWTNGGVPELLGAVKRSVDEGPSPGRYILTGSVRAELEKQVWPGTAAFGGPMSGMSVRELGEATPGAFIDGHRRGAERGHAPDERSAY